MIRGPGEVIARSEATKQLGPPIVIARKDASPDEAISY